MLELITGHDVLMVKVNEALRAASEKEMQQRNHEEMRSLMFKRNASPVVKNAPDDQVSFDILNKKHLKVLRQLVEYWNLPGTTC